MVFFELKSNRDLLQLVVPRHQSCLQPLNLPESVNVNENVNVNEKEVTDMKLVLHFYKFPDLVLNTNKKKDDFAADNEMLQCRQLTSNMSTNTPFI